MEGAVLASCVRVLRGGSYWGGVEVSGRPKLGPGLGGPGDTMRYGGGESSGIGSGRPLLQGKRLPEGEGAEVGSSLLSCRLARTLAFLRPVLHGQLVLSGPRG